MISLQVVKSFLAKLLFDPIAQQFLKCNCQHFALYDRMCSVHSNLHEIVIGQTLLVVVQAKIALDTYIDTKSIIP